MSPTAAFILGLLIGLLVEWVIDWLYWRRRVKVLQTELDQAKAGMAGSANVGMEGQLAAMADLTSLQQTNAGLEADNSALKQQLSALKMEKSTLAQELEACRGKLVTAAQAPIPAEVPAPVRLTKAAPIVPDELEIIKGIGPVIKHRLNQGGILTFEQLAGLTPARLREIVGDVIQRLADEDDIIAQAKELAARKAGGG
jgi:predicted flap endonuclease-1-like 5' DNA nuclease